MIVTTNDRTIVSQKSFVPHPQGPGWDKTFLDIYTIASRPAGTRPLGAMQSQNDLRNVAARRTYDYDSSCYTGFDSLRNEKDEI